MPGKTIDRSGNSDLKALKNIFGSVIHGGEVVLHFDFRRDILMGEIKKTHHFPLTFRAACLEK